MAGHNKWSKVKHIKEVVDAKRGKIFTKLAKEITVAVRQGGKDIDLNPRLRSAINSAKGQNMPKNNIDRAIQKGAGNANEGAYEEITYEGYGPNGIAFIVETATDNKNRSAGDIRSIFNKSNGNLGSSGSVLHSFDKRGELQITKDEFTEDDILEFIVENDAIDFKELEESYLIYVKMADLNELYEKCNENKMNVLSQKIIYYPKNVIEINTQEQYDSIMKLYDKLDNYEDTINVYSNFNMEIE